VSIPQGGTLDYDNAAQAPHNIFANDAGPDGGPLFELPTFVGPATKPVEGVQYLTAGTYEFYCTLHETMTGTLTVTSAGTPVRRPAIGVAIESSTLKQVRKSGVLKVKLHNSGSAGDADLVASLNGREIGHAGQVEVGTGDRVTVSVKLSKSGRKALVGRSKASVKVGSTVDFGEPDSAKKKLD
jgi:hypothetical protein